MATKITGISRDLLIHPGETISDILLERGITQAELATRTGVTPAYISNVIAGKKDISAKFAFSLEYALGVPKSFWINLQANYDAELLELNAEQTIVSEERVAREALTDIVKYLRQQGKMPARETINDSILSLRKALQISNLSNLKTVVSDGAFRMSSSAAINPYVLGAWIRLCQMAGDGKTIENQFDPNKVHQMTLALKNIMCNQGADIQKELSALMEQYGVDFSIVRHFRGAPVHGYISCKNDGAYQMVLTIRGAYADIFWFSLFHELGHLVNGDIGRTSKFIDYGNNEEQEEAANLFASTMLINPKSYEEFVNREDFSINAIKSFANTQNIMPFIVIGRLQREKHLGYKCYSEYKPRYKWAN